MSPRPVAENLRTLQYRLGMLGAPIDRTVTIIRLRSGKLAIHSTAASSPEDVAAIQEPGEPGWLVDVVNSTTPTPRKAAPNRKRPPGKSGGGSRRSGP